MEIDWKDPQETPECGECHMQVGRQHTASCHRQGLVTGMSCKCSCSFCEELLALKKKYDTDLERARNQVREQYLRLCDLYPALLTMMRAIENGHPIGHDAVLQARRALKRAHLGAVPKTNPDYSCYCTVCAKKRKVAKP